MLVSGQTVASDAGAETAKYLAGALLFDGNGNLSASNVYSGSASSSAATGTYSLNTDCTLTILLTVVGTPVQTYTVAVASSREAVGIEVDASAVATIDLEAQYATYTPGLNFTNSSLAGKFTAACIGPLAADSDLSVAIYAGGSVAGTGAYNNGGSFVVANNPISGSYSVNSDGTFTGTWLLNGQTLDVYGVLSNAGTEVEYFFTNPSGGQPTAAFASCVSKQ